MNTSIREVWYLAVGRKPNPLSMVHDAAVIGVYSSKEAAELSKSRLQEKSPIAADDERQYVIERMPLMHLRTSVDGGLVVY